MPGPDGWAPSVLIEGAWHSRSAWQVWFACIRERTYRHARGTRRERKNKKARPRRGMHGMADRCRLPTTTTTTTTTCSSSCNGPAPQQVTLDDTGPKRGRRGIREEVLVGLRARFKVVLLTWWEGFDRACRGGRSGASEWVAFFSERDDDAIACVPVPIARWPSTPLSLRTQLFPSLRYNKIKNMAAGTGLGMGPLRRHPDDGGQWVSKKKTRSREGLHGRRPGAAKCARVCMCGLGQYNSLRCNQLE